MNMLQLIQMTTNALHRDSTKFTEEEYGRIVTSVNDSPLLKAYLNRFSPYGFKRLWQNTIQGKGEIEGRKALNSSLHKNVPNSIFALRREKKQRRDERMSLEPPASLGKSSVEEEYLAIGVDSFVIRTSKETQASELLYALYLQASSSLSVAQTNQILPLDMNRPTEDNNDNLLEEMSKLSGLEIDHLETLVALAAGSYDPSNLFAALRVRRDNGQKATQSWTDVLSVSAQLEALEKSLLIQNEGKHLFLQKSFENWLTESLTKMNKAMLNRRFNGDPYEDSLAEQTVQNFKKMKITGLIASDRQLTRIYSSIGIMDSVFVRISLSCCVHQGYERTVKAIFNSHPEWIEEVESSDLLTHLCIACDRGYTEIVRLFLENMPALEVQDHSFPKGCHNYLYYRSIIYFNGETPLHIACKGGHIATVKLILEHMNVYIRNDENVSVNIKNNDDETPLHLACKGGHIEIVALLLNYQPDLNIRERIWGLTPLHLACRIIRIDIVRLLIENGANIDIPDCYGCTPLYNTILKRNSKIVNLLIENGAEVNKSSETMRSVLDLFPFPFQKFEILKKSYLYKPNRRTYFSCMLNFASALPNYGIFSLSSFFELSHEMKKLRTDLEHEVLQAIHNDNPEELLKYSRYIINQIKSQHTNLPPTKHVEIREDFEESQGLLTQQPKFESFPARLTFRRKKNSSILSENSCTHTNMSLTQRSIQEKDSLKKGVK